MESQHGVILAHGGMSGTADLFIGIAPVLIGCLLLGYFILLLAGSKTSSAQSGERDHRPTPGRLMFSGAYYQLEEMLCHETKEPDRPRGQRSRQQETKSESQK
jgi:hypothetical protein